MRLRRGILFIGLLAAPAGCFRYVTTYRPMLASECPPDTRPHAFARFRPDSTQPRTIHGRVIDVEVRDTAKRGLSAVSVYIEGTQQGTYTDATGEFRIGGVAPGSHVVVARRIAYPPQRDSIVIATSAGAELEIGLRSEPLDGCPGFAAIIERKRVWHWPWQ